MTFVTFWKALLGRFVGTWIVLGSMWSFNLTTPQTPQENPESWRYAKAPLKAFARPHNLNMGVAVSHRYLNDATYATLVTQQFDMIVAENSMKFKQTHSHPATYTFDKADKVMAFAQRHDLKVRGHTLIWYGAKWVRERHDNEGWTEGELKQMMTDHITTVVGRYKGQVEVWDVVNEAISGYWGLRNNVWTEVIGEQFIDHAFAVAHRTDPDAKLFYNDFRVEGLNPKANRLYALAKRLLERGVPIDGVGLQTHMHFSLPSQKKLIAHLQRLADLGLEIHLTEIDLGFRRPVTNGKLIKQAIRYYRLTEACLAVPACTTMVFWGATDNHSWVPLFFKPYDAPLLFDADFQPKLAYHAIANALWRAGHPTDEQ